MPEQSSQNMPLLMDMREMVPCLKAFSARPGAKKRKTCAQEGTDITKGTLSPVTVLPDRLLQEQAALASMLPVLWPACPFARLSFCPAQGHGDMGAAWEHVSLGACHSVSRPLPSGRGNGASAPRHERTLHERTLHERTRHEHLGPETTTRKRLLDEHAHLNLGTADAFPGLQRL